MPNTDRDNSPTNGASQPSFYWKPHVINYRKQYPLFESLDCLCHGATEAGGPSAAAAPAFAMDEDRRLRVQAWVEEGNKSRSSRRHLKRPRKSRLKSAETPPVLLPNLPSRPDLVKLTPLQYWVGGADRRPPFIGWFRCKDGTTKSAVLQLTAEEFGQMDSQFTAHILARFRTFAEQRSLKEVTSSDLTEGHWMSEWWHQLHYDLPVSCSVLMERLDLFNPLRTKGAH